MSTEDDPRLRDIVQPFVAGPLEDTSRLDVVIVGFPYHEGTLRNGGRGGSDEGPRVFREHMMKTGCVVNPEFNIDLRHYITLRDAGDIPRGIPLEEAHERLREKVTEIVSFGSIPFVVGGSNDQSFPNAQAFLSKYPRGGVVNVDAHLDVRPLKDGMVHSGSPFRLLLDSPLFAHGNHFAEFAAQGSQCSQSHAEFVLSKGHAIKWLLRDLRKDTSAVPQCFTTTLDTLGDDVFVSFDIDSIHASDCAGVSCPSSIGLTAHEALQMCMAAGAHSNVRMMDLSEFNPSAEAYLTGRLTANMLYYFLLGLAQRCDGIMLSRHRRTSSGVMPPSHGYHD